MISLLLCIGLVQSSQVRLLMTTKLEAGSVTMLRPANVPYSLDRRVNKGAHTLATRLLFKPRTMPKDTVRGVPCSAEVGIEYGYERLGLNIDQCLKFTASTDSL